MKGCEDGQALCQQGDLCIPEGLACPIEENPKTPVATVLEKNTDLIADLRLGEKLGHVFAALQIIIGKMLERHDAELPSFPPARIKGIVDIVIIEIAADHLVGKAPMFDEFGFARLRIAGDGDQVMRNQRTDDVDQTIDM